MGLDLEPLKDQVLSMRSLVKQTKNHLINKLTREAKKLREKKGTEEQKKKNAKKADRFIEEVMLMKKLQPDEVSKFVLKTENCEKVLSKPDIPLETKVFARFGAHKILSPIITKFHADYPSWKENIEDLVKKLIIEPKQVVSAHNTSLNSSIVRTAGNNVFSVTPVKQSLSTKSQNILSCSSKLDKINGAKSKQAQIKKENKNSPSVGNKTPVQSNEHNAKRSIFADSSFENDEENAESDNDDISEEIFSKALKRQKADESDSEDSNEDEESSVDSDEISQDGEEIFLNKSAKSSSKIVKTLNLKETNVSGKTIKKQKMEADISDFNKKPAEKTHFTEDLSFKNSAKKQSKLNEELDEIEERLNRKKSSKQVVKVEELPEESVDPFFVTPEGEEYISSAPIVKNEDKPPNNFQSSSTPQEFYRKGKKITPSFQGQRKSFDNRSRNNSFNRNDNRGSFNRNDNRNSFNRNDSRNSFNRNDNRNSFNRNDNRNSFNKNDSRSSFNRNDSKNSFNRNDNRKSFNRNDNRNSFGDKRNSYDRNEKRSSFNGNFNAKNRFSNNKNESKFNSRKQDTGNNEHLHPSWEAKKKMLSLAPFQGIKTVFNE